MVQKTDYEVLRLLKEWGYITPNISEIALYTNTCYKILNSPN